MARKRNRKKFHSKEAKELYLIRRDLENLGSGEVDIEDIYRRVAELEKQVGIVDGPSIDEVATDDVELGDAKEDYSEPEVESQDDDFEYAETTQDDVEDDDDFEYAETTEDDVEDDDDFEYAETTEDDVEDDDDFEYAETTEDEQSDVVASEDDTTVKPKKAKRVKKKKEKLDYKKQRFNIYLFFALICFLCAAGVFAFFEYVY